MRAEFMRLWKEMRRRLWSTGATNALLARVSFRELPPIRKKSILFVLIAVNLKGNAPIKENAMPLMPRTTSGKVTVAFIYAMQST